MRRYSFRREDGVRKFLEAVKRGDVRVKVGAASDMIVYKGFTCFLVSKFFERIGP